MATIAVSVAGVTASFAVVDLLARLLLESRRLGLELELRDVSDDLRQLIELSGLTDALLSGSVGSPP